MTKPRLATEEAAVIMVRAFQDRVFVLGEIGSPCKKSNKVSYLLTRQVCVQHVSEVSLVTNK